MGEVGRAVSDHKILRHEQNGTYVQLEHTESKGWEVQAGFIDEMVHCVQWVCGNNAGVVIGTYAVVRSVMEDLKPNMLLPVSDITPWTEDFKFIMYMGWISDGRREKIEQLVSELEDVNLNALRRSKDI